MDLIEAHKHSSKHRDEIEASDRCGCFYCIQIFDKSEIKQWVDKGRTALCPYCHIDAVIGSKSGIEISVELLKSLNKRWFKNGMS